MKALKGSSVTEEIERDAQEINKAGGGSREVVELGAGLLEEPTFAVIITRDK